MDDTTKSKYLAKTNMGDLVPIPDPTLLTSALVEKAMLSLESKLETRFNAMDKAADLLHADFTRVPTEMDRAITHLRELLTADINKLKEANDEVFKRIEVQFTERDKRTDQLALASSTAIAAALQAAKEAVGAQNTSNSIAIAKSESSTLESLRQLRELFTSVTNAINSKVEDIKTRLDKGEGQPKGGGDAWGIFVGAGGMVIAVVSVIALVLTRLH
jgi:hypothetical protein